MASPSRRARAYSVGSAPTGWKPAPATGKVGSAAATVRVGGPSTAAPGQISFYNKGQPYYELTNFSPHPVEYEGKNYPTAEHLYQAMKFYGDNRCMEFIRLAPTSREAFNDAHILESRIRPDWRSVNLTAMRQVLEHKAAQHEEIYRSLMSTGDAELVEDSPNDSFWGAGSDGRGQNMLGKLWMELRTRYQLAEPADSGRVRERQPAPTPPRHPRRAQSGSRRSIYAL